MATKYKSSDAGNLDMPKRSPDKHPLSKKVKVLGLRQEKYHMLRLLRPMVKNISLLFKTMKKKKETHDCFFCCTSNCKSYSQCVLSA
jgi:hypothetical protein